MEEDLDELPRPPAAPEDADCTRPGQECASTPLPVTAEANPNPQSRTATPHLAALNLGEPEADLLRTATPLQDHTCRRPQPVNRIPSVAAYALAEPMR
jgi:hypothetical protein